MDSSEFQFQFIHLNSVDSSNIYALELLDHKKTLNGVIVTTKFQERGKGQLGQSWESEYGKNLLFSIIVEPKVKLEDQFKISQLVSISLKEWLDTLTVGEVQIKWPNDILVGSKKAAGVLIENSIQGREISNSIIGIGLNVNQKEFSPFPRPATSLLREKNQEYDLVVLLKDFLNLFWDNFQAFKIQSVNLNDRYLSSLYGYGKPLRLSDKNGEFLGVIIGVLPNGKLQVNRNGKLKSYDLKELKFLD